jgi:hypothetical protein
VVIGEIVSVIGLSWTRSIGVQKTKIFPITNSAVYTVLRSRLQMDDRSLAFSVALIAPESTNHDRKLSLV